MRHRTFAAAIAIATFAAQIRAEAAVSVFETKSGFDAAVSTTLIENFETGITKNQALSSFTHNGVTYTGAPSHNVYVIGPGATNFGSGVPQPTTTSLLTASGDEDFTAAFATPVGAVGFDTYFNGLGPVSVKVFGAHGLLTTFSVTPGKPLPNGVGYLGFVTTDEPITSFEWTSTDGDTLNTGIDNIATAPVVSVPEPSAYAAMLSGLCMVMGLTFRVSSRRRRPGFTSARP